MRYRRILIVLVVAFFTVQLSGCSKNPVTGQQELSLVGEKQEIETGKEYYPMMTQMNNGELQDQNLQEYVNKIGQQIADVSHNPDLPFKFNIVNTSTPNAYALPGGFISVTRGLLLKMDDEDQLAAVIGHEIAHATARHYAQQKTQSVFTGLLLTAGSIYLKSEGVQNVGLYQDLGRIGAQAMLASYSRSQEAQADRLGLRYMAKAGYDPNGMVELQQILLRQRKREPGALKQIFASHPLSESRIKKAKEQIPNLRSKIQIPTNNQANRFQPLVMRTWIPRKPAYEHMDTGVKKLKDDLNQEAVDNFQNAIDRYRGEALFHAWNGKAYDESGRYSKARESLNRAIQMNPNVFRIQLFSGINFFNLDKYRDSLSALERAESLLPKIPDVKYYRGRNHEALGNRDKAAGYYKGYLKQVKKGEKAQYAARRLREWGYVSS